MSDSLDIPDFLKRPPLTEEQRARLDRLTVQARNPKIKNPPRKASRKSKLLGLPATVRVVTR